MKISSYFVVTVSMFYVLSEDYLVRIQETQHSNSPLEMEHKLELLLPTVLDHLKEEIPLEQQDNNKEINNKEDNLDLEMLLNYQILSLLNLQKMILS